LLLLLVAGVMASGCGGNDANGAEPAAEEAAVVEITPELLTFGKETYARNCAPCHGPGGKGDGPSAATLNPPPRDHTNAEYMSTLTDKKIADTIKMGGIISGYPNMPSNPHLKREEIEALVAYVRSLSDPDAAKIDLAGF
jgi:mono/diheme cytochrome c family protein